MSKSCVQISEKSEPETVDRRRRHGNGTEFGRWTDPPLSPSRYREGNSKKYPAVESRYRTTKPCRDRCGRVDDVSVPNTDKHKGWLKEEKARLAEYNRPGQMRANLLLPADLTYLEMVEADGPMDRAAAALNYLLLVDEERVLMQKKGSEVIPSVGSEARLLAAVKEALIKYTEYDDNRSWALCLLRAALVFVGDIANRWLWSIELFAMTALSMTCERTRDEAICMFGIGYGYTTDTDNNNTELVVQYLDRAIKLSDQHRHDWLLPFDILDTTGVPANHNRVWAAACFVKHEVLMKAARTTLKDFPDLALLAVENAYHLVKELCRNSGEQGRSLRLSRATVAYELGVRYTAVGVPDRAAEFFSECAVAANGLDTDLVLEAQLEAVRLCPEPPPMGRDAAFQRIADDALARHNVPVLVKATAARGYVAMDEGKPKEAYRRFAVAQQLAVEMGHHVDDSIRFYTAVNRTWTFMQSNFPVIRARDYDLLAEPRLWTGDERPLLVHSPGNKIFLNADRIQDTVVGSDVRGIVRKLNLSADEPVHSNQTDVVVADTKIIRKKVTFK